MLDETGKLDEQSLENLEWEIGKWHSALQSIQPAQIQKFEGSQRACLSARRLCWLLSLSMNQSINGSLARPWLDVREPWRQARFSST